MQHLAILLAIFLLMYVSAQITPLNFETISSGAAFSDLSAFLQGKTVSVSSAQAFFSGIEGMLGLLGIVFFAGIIWFGLRTGDIHHKEHAQYKPIPVEEVEAKGYHIAWQVVREHMDSLNPGEWKLAILEADNMLDEILEDQGYVGETVADKLKEMSPTRITAYDELWEAHKLRNKIAHGGAIDMDLTQKSARDAITGFEKAFKELGYL